MFFFSQLWVFLITSISLTHTLVVSQALDSGFATTDNKCAQILTGTSEHNTSTSFRIILPTSNPSEKTEMDNIMRNYLLLEQSHRMLKP